MKEEVDWRLQHKDDPGDNGTDLEVVRIWLEDTSEYDLERERGHPEKVLTPSIRLACCHWCDYA